MHGSNQISGRADLVDTPHFETKRTGRPAAGWSVVYGVLGVVYTVPIREGFGRSCTHHKHFLTFLDKYAC